MTNGSRWRVGVRLRAAIIAVLMVFLGTADRAAAEAASAPRGTPTAHVIAGRSTVGPLFADGLDQDYTCTASVVSSRTRDLVLTAAHCLDGSAVGWQFVPAYDRGRAPYGVWTVVHAYLPAGWLRDQDPRDDFAVLQLAKKTRDGRRVGVQDVTGAELVGHAPQPGSTITAIAYNSGSDGRPISCTTRTYRTGGYPSFDCHGYVDGSSGSPWLGSRSGTRQPVVRGVIGGLHQGGCFEYTSYSSAFGATFASSVGRLLSRAVRRDHPDRAPEAGGDGC